MRHIFPTYEIAHLWAHQTQKDARNPGGRFYFQGNTIYSYGSHFPIAQHVVNRNGERAILITTRGYSTTTAKHIGLVRRAIPADVPVFNVDIISRYGWDMAFLGRLKVSGEVEYDAKIQKLKGTYLRARSRKVWAWKSLELVVNEANRFLDWVGSDSEWWVASEDVAATKREIAEAVAKERERERKREEEKKKKEEEKEKKARVDLIEWKNGSAMTSHVQNLQKIYLRVKGKNVETSHGAVFPVTHAARAVRWVRNVRERGVEYVYDPANKAHHLGHYRIDRIETNGTVHAGCHVVEWDEIERIEPELLRVVALPMDAVGQVGDVGIVEVESVGRVGRE